MTKRAPKAQITDYDREYLSKLLEQSTANARKATEQANKLEIKISKYNAYSEYYKKLIDSNAQTGITWWNWTAI
jgi:hypothetical protein